MVVIDIVPITGGVSVRYFSLLPIFPLFFLYYPFPNTLPSFPFSLTSFSYIILNPPKLINWCPSICL